MIYEHFSCKLFLKKSRGLPHIQTVYRKGPAGKGGSLFQSIARGAMVREAVAAVDGLVATRLEGNLRLLAAVGADRGEHLALRTGIAVGGAERGTALRAAARLVLEALLGIESLLGSTEDEFLAAVTANEGFVLIHNRILLNND